VDLSREGLERSKQIDLASAAKVRLRA